MAWKLLLVLLEEAAEAALSAGVWDMTGVGDDEGTTEVMWRMVDDIKMARGATASPHGHTSQNVGGRQ